MKMTEAEFNHAFESGALDNEYYDFVFNRMEFSSEEAVFLAVECNDYLDDFRDRRITK
jgi:hypothetical protein